MKTLASSRAALLALALAGAAFAAGFLFPTGAQDSAASPADLAVAAEEFDDDPLAEDEEAAPADPVAQLRMQRFPAYYYGENPLTPTPAIILRFSQPVELAAAGEALAFVARRDARRIPARALRPPGEELAALQPHDDSGTRAELGVEHFVLVTPSEPLAVGFAWDLMVSGSLASMDGAQILGRDRTESLGRLDAFALSEVFAANEYNEPLAIEIAFNKWLSEEVAEEDLGQWIAVSPQPPGLAFAKNYRMVTVKGAFEYGRTYQVTVSPGLEANDQTRLEAGEAKSVEFTPNDGFITLPALSTAQHAAGGRRFDILTANLKGTRVRAKLLEGRDLVFASRAYEDLYQGIGEERELPFEAVPGRVIYDQEHPRTAEIDRSERITLDWDALLERQPRAAVYLCAEGYSDTKQGHGVGAQAIIQLTDIGLAWKQDLDQVQLFAFSLETGEPLPGVKLQALDSEAGTLAEAAADGQGLAILPRARLEEARWLLAEHGEDRHLARAFGPYDAVGLWQFAIPYRYEELEGPERRVLMFTDRDLFRPGETVHLKAVSRLADGDQLLPAAQAGGKARLKVSDPRGRTVLEQEVEFSARGSFDLAFELPESRALGWHSLELDCNDPEGQADRPWMNVFHHGFRVADYRPNTFEVDIDTSGAAESAGPDYRVPVTAAYYMGKPLSQAQLNWQVSASPTWPEPRGFERFQFGDTVTDRSGFTASEKTRLGENGEARIDFTLPSGEGSPAPLQVRVRAEITDINQQTVAGSARFVVDSSDFYLGLRAPEGVTRAGEETVLALAAVAPDGTPREGAVEALMTVEKVTWHTVRVRGAGGRITSRNEKEVTPVLERSVTVETRIESATGLPVPGEIPLRLAEGGDYQITFRARDERGREVVTRSSLTIIGADEPSWSWHDGNRIDVLPDRERYRVGDTAKLLVRSPVFGHALVTVERGGVRQVIPREITEHETVLEVPLGEDAAPNLFVSVLIVRGSAGSQREHPAPDYRLGYCQLVVDDPGVALQVAIEQDEAPWQVPGAEVTLGARVTSADGRPVPGAEVTLWAVDEGVLSLAGYETPDPGATFHEPFPLGVFTGQTISSLLPESPHEQNWGNKGYVIGGGGDASGLDPAKVRKNFQALAFWRGGLVTDAEGRVSATFTAPDNLTSFRVIAVAAEESRFGSGEDRMVVNKPLILEPALPAFGNAGDLIDLSAILHNNTGSPVELEIRVDLDEHAEFVPETEALLPTALARAGEPDQPRLRVRRLALAPGATAKASFPALFLKPGEAKWTWQAVSTADPALSDAVESTLAIGYPGPLLRETRSALLAADGQSADLAAGVDPRLLQGRGEVRVTLSNSRALEALEALDYLLQYPYGCVEQTASSLLPWLTTQTLREALPPLRRGEAESAAVIARGARRLIDMQTGSGGLSYWPGGSQPSLWGSAYGGMVLALAERAGAELPAERTAALWKYLSDQLRDSAEKEDPALLYQTALAAYALSLAGQAEPAYHELLHGKRAQLSRDARALVALAMLEAAAGERDAVLAGRVADLLAPPPAGEEDEENPSHWYRSHYAAAVELLAWSAWEPGSERAEALLDELLGVPKGRAAWGSTYLNSWGMLALARHSEAAAAALQGTVCQVSFAGETREVAFGNRLAGESLVFPFEGDFRGLPVQVSIGTPSRIYAHVEIASQPEVVPREAEHHGLGIERSYRRLLPDGSAVPVESLETGDLVLVTLRLSVPDDGAPVHHLAVEDPLPAVFEAVNPEFKTQGGDQRRPGLGGGHRMLHANHTELRTDRALFFCDYLHRGGDYAVQYLARVVAPGEATAPPAKAELMYEPQRFGLSSSVRVTAKALPLAPPGRVAGQ